MKAYWIPGPRWPQLSLLAVFLLVGFLASASWAQVDYNWSANSGDWGTAANWNPNTGPPATDDTAHLEQNDAINRTVSYRNIFATTPTLAGVSLNSSGTGTMTLELAQGGAAGALQAVNVWVGRGLLHQTSGSLTVDYELILGNEAGIQGTYNMAGGDLTSTYLVVGNLGTGTFTQSEPGPNPTTVSVANSLNLGQGAGSSGTYTLQDGMLLSSYTNVGGDGTGTFTQSGGIHTVGNELYLGVATGSSGRYNLSGTGVLATSNTIVGNEGAGVFNQSGGGHLVANVLTLGLAAGSSGTYDLTAGALGADYAFIGDGGNGTFTQSQKTATPTTVEVATGLGVGRGQDSTSTYNLQGGTLAIGDAANPGDLWVGAAGRGLFNQTGGSNTVTGGITLGEAVTGRGEYRLGNGTLTTNNLDVGQEGIGAFTQSAGTTLNVTGNLMINSQAGTSTFTQLGGATAVTNHLGVGRDPNGRAEYILQNGNLAVGELYVGHGGNGTFTQNGGSLTVNNIWMADELTGRGTLTLQGGSLTFRDPNSGSLNVGGQGIGNFIQGAGLNLTLDQIFVNSQAGTSTFTQMGGTTTLNSHLGVGRDVGRSGLYTLQDGTLNTGQIFLGHGGTGTFTQRGGTVNVTDDIRMGDAGTGNFNLENGNLSTAYTRVGIGGTGNIFTQTGGTHTVANTLILAENPGSSGTYNLNNGSLDVTSVDLNAGGIFNQTGGTLNFTTFNHQGGTVQGNLQNLAGGTYIYTSGLFPGRLLNYGTANFNANFTASNGMAHFSTLTLAAGRTLTLNGQGLEVDQGGAFTQTGGNLTAARETIGNTGVGTFTQSGGSHTVTSVLTLAANPGSGGTYNLQGGTLAAETINLNTGGLLNRTGGTLNFTTLNLPGGTFQGDLDTLATVTGSGTIRGAYTNRGTVNPGNSPGTLNVVGSFNQTATGNYVLEIASATNYDKIAVTGTATVGGTLTPTLLGGFVPAPNQVFPGIITATGGITGNFSTIDSILRWKLLYNTNNIDLMLASKNYADPSLPLTPNQRNVGMMFNSVADSASGDLAAVLDVVSSLPTGAAVASAYQQISPDKASALPALSLAGAMMQWRSLVNRLNYVRWSEGVGQAFSGGGSGNFNFSYSRLAGLMLAYNGSDLGSLVSPARSQRQNDKPWGVYTDFVGTMGSLNSTPNQTGYDLNIFGFNSGIDYRLRDNLILGLGSGYYHTGSNFRGSGGSVEVNSIPFYAYGAYFPGSFYAMGSLGYTLNLYGLNRNLSFGGLNRVAETSVNGNQLNISGETGYDLAFRGLILTPAVSLYYSQAWVGGFTEGGANSLSLKVSPQSADSLQTGLGVRVARPFKAGNTLVLPQASAFYQHEFSNNTRGLDARLAQSGSTFNFQTDSPSRNFAVLGAGAAVGLKKNLFVQANYNTEVGRGNYTAHYVSAGLRWEF